MQICVTGGSSGIGAAVSEAFAESGGRVFINYHSDDAAAEKTKALVEAKGAIAHLVKASVGTPQGVRELFETVSTHTDRLDRLVLCAARPTPGPVLEIEPEAWIESAAVNALSIVWAVREALPLLKPGASVVYITSRGGRTVIPGYGGLGSAKAFAESLVRHLAYELAPHGVRMNAISPGALDTPAFRKMYPDTWQQRLEALIKASPAGRAMTFADVVAAIDAVSRSDLGMLQGQIIQVDGGTFLAH